MSETETSFLHVERYMMSLPVTITLGEPQDFRVRDWTASTFRAEKLIANAPCEGFVEIESACVDSVDVLLNDDGSERFESHDAFYFLNEGRGRKIKPYLCEHGVSMRIKYTGTIPEGFERGRAFTFVLSFSGPAGASLSQPQPD